MRNNDQPPAISTRTQTLSFLQLLFTLAAAALCLLQLIIAWQEDNYDKRNENAQPFLILLVDLLMQGVISCLRNNEPGSYCQRLSRKVEVCLDILLLGIVAILLTLGGSYSDALDIITKITACLSEALAIGTSISILKEPSQESEALLPVQAEAVQGYEAVPRATAVQALSPAFSPALSYRSPSPVTNPTAAPAPDDTRAALAPGN